MGSLTLALACLFVTPAADPAPANAKEALKPFNLFVGKWKGTGIPDTAGGKPKEFWSETVAWEWHFKGDDVWLTATFDKSPHYKTGDLRYLADKKAYTFEVTTTDKKSLTFQGPLTPGKGKEQVLTLDRTDDTAKTTERLVFTLLHSNRYLYRLDSKPTAAASFARQFQVGETKEGESFADVPKGPECVVSGGTGTMRVTHGGKTYYVCCSGCRDAFKDEPEKYIKEYEAKLKAEAEKKGKK
ncbi:TRASH domain-containing protein [Limnoglobus roseus]|uniref:YHS domain-containing protein n=1 Tax=Limnoglobus roseus TaxID=2598579 RepID=A0A5C1AP80_9BACT|nr:TRASH domain-containing protein [Limnoglobus roseus]QEL19024.1 YHS domain-containing protein [Limnoglobus roseus]